MLRMHMTNLAHAFGSVWTRRTNFPGPVARVRECLDRAAVRETE
jgi:hypothetical protein